MAMRGDGEVHGVYAPFHLHGFSLQAVSARVDHHPLSVLGSADQNPVRLTSVDDLDADGLKLSGCFEKTLKTVARSRGGWDAAGHAGMRFGAGRLGFIC